MSEYVYTYKVRLVGCSKTFDMITRRRLLAGDRVTYEGRELVVEYVITAVVQGMPPVAVVRFK